MMKPRGQDRAREQGRPRESGQTPRDPEEASRIVPIRMTDTERIEYQKAAERCGLSLSQWVRAQLNRAAKRQAKDA